MINVLIIADKSEAITMLQSELVHNGFTCFIASDDKQLGEQVDSDSFPGLVLLEIDNISKRRELYQMMKRQRPLPVIIALVGKRMLAGVIHADMYQGVDDFIVKPYNIKELVTRIERLMQKTSRRSSEVIECGDLIIDLAKCEVNIGRRLIELTYKEYELLKFMVSNKGRVFTRASLLNKVWGYDYFGGDRTVDVHIRRLRSKIEDPDHVYIETVRNIGYRLKCDQP